MGIVRALQRGWRVRPRQKHLSTLCLPVTRGPIENFYHFFMGYFVPLYWERTHRPEEPVAVMSVPPYDHWFDLLPGTPPRIVGQAKAMKHAFLSDSRGYAQHYRVKGMMYWDKGEKFPERPLKTIAAQLHDGFREKTADVSTSAPEVVVIVRDYPPRTHSQHLTKPYGASKRNIPTLPEVIQLLQKHHTVELLDGASTPPAEMFVKCQNAKVLIGQHGARLTNAFFLAPGAAMVKIVWPELLADAHAGIYGPLCDQLGLDRERELLQDHPFSTVKPERVLNSVLSLRR